MKDIVVNKIMINIEKNNNNLDITKLEEIRYGLLGLYTLVTKTSIILLLSIILGIFKEFIIFMAFYSWIRTVGFGSHAKSNIHCWIFSSILLLGIPYLFNIISISNTIKILLWSICFVNYLIFCPADTDKRPIISKTRKLVFKLIVLIISIIYLVLIIKFDNISNLIIGAMILEALLTNPLGYILMGQKVRFKLNDIYLFKQKKKEEEEC